MKYRIEDKYVFMTLDPGDEINKTFEDFALSKGIGSSWINGIGAIENPEIGYYSVEEKKYYKKIFTGEFEITSLIGNITIKDGQPYSHTHITFSDINFKVYGGHLFNANVSAAGEFMLYLGNKDIGRKMNDGIGLPLWCMESSSD
jgi:Predicted DNA-binding protein with PD1-like DNA-binding motif